MSRNSLSAGGPVPPFPPAAAPLGFGEALSLVREFLAPLSEPSFEELDESGEHTPPSPPIDPALPDLLKVGTIAHGGMGTLSRAFDRRHGREVTVLDTPVGSPARDRAFVRLGTRGPLTHPWILSVLEVVRSGSRWLVVRRFVEGPDLVTYPATNRRPKVADAVLVVYRLADAVEFGRAQGLVLAKIEPGGVILSHTGPRGVRAGGAVYPYLVDDFVDPNDLEAGQVSGAPGLIPPEVLDGSGPLDARGNVFGLGVLLYYVLTGHWPFDGTTPRERLEATLRGQPAPPTKHNFRIPKALEEVCLKAIAASPGDRYATAGEFRAALLPFLNPGSLLPEDGPDVPPRRKRKFWR